MKAILLCCAVAMLLAGCSKEEKPFDNNGLLGKWKLKEVFWSPGAGGEWHAVPAADQSIIEFLADSSFTCTPNFSKANLQLNRFSLTGNELNMSSTLNNNTDKWYVMHLDNNRLELSIDRCFEGCYAAFVAVE